jgi:hypothetical protein
MFDLILLLCDWFWGLWDSLPPAVKRKVIEAIVISFDTLLRAAYGGTP